MPSSLTSAETDGLRPSASGETRLRTFSQPATPPPVRGQDFPGSPIANSAQCG